MMSEIGLQKLIYQVKRELLETNQALRAKDPYPLFLIDNIEIEVAIKVSKTQNSEVKITVLDYAELTMGKTIAHEQGHVIKISLTPLLARDEILADVLKDSRVRSAIKLDLERSL